VSLQFMIEIDLAGADLDAFDRYEAAVLAVLTDLGGTVLARVRDSGASREWHLLQVPDRSVWDAFLRDPRRLAQARMLEPAMVTASRYEVRPIG